MNALAPTNARSAASLFVRAAQLSAEALASVREQLDAWLAYEAPGDDPLPDMIAEHERLVAAFCLLHEDDAHARALNEAFNDLEARICTTKALTTAGLLAQAEFVRGHLAEEYGARPGGEDNRPDHERGFDTVVEGLRHLLGRPVSITAHLTAADTDPLPELVAEWKRRRADADAAETDEEVEERGRLVGDMDRPICLAKPLSLSGLKAQGEFLRHELKCWGDTGLGKELSCIVDHFFYAVGALQDGPAVPVGAIHPETEDRPSMGSKSPLRALYDRWRAAKAEHRALPDDHDEATADSLYQRIWGIECEALAYEPRSIEDLAIQIIFADDDGDMNVNTNQEALASRAYAISGIEPPTTYGARAEVTAPEPDKPPVAA